MRNDDQRRPPAYGDRRTEAGRRNQWERSEYDDMDAGREAWHARRDASHGAWAGRDESYGRGRSRGSYGSGDSAAGRRQRILPKGYQRSDERIHEDVCEQLSRSGLDVSDVSVKVSQGEVTLEGTVGDRSVKHAVENCADGCIGVKDVDNRLRVQREQPATMDAANGTQAG